MQKRNFLPLALVAAVLMMFSACDNTTEPEVGPSLTTTAADLDTVFTDSAFTIRITASRGSSSLTRLEVRENGTAISANRLEIDGFTAGGNPSPLAASATSGFSYDLTITAGSDDGEVSTYSVIVTDSLGLTSTVTFDIFTEDFGTLVTERTVILLLNQAGPAGQGGLDLESGNSTGTSQAADSIADIRDMGIDTNIPVATNWLQQIGVINGSDLRYPSAGFSYDNVIVSEEVSAAFEAGQVFTTSDKVEVGDVFLCKTRRGNVYVLKTISITVTPNDNADQYEFSVKN